MRSLLCGTAYHELHRAGAEFLAAHRDGEVLVIGASRGVAEEFARAVSDSGTLGVHTVTLTQVVTTLAASEVAARGLTPISALSQEALAARVVHDTYSQLEYFGPVARMPGFVRALASTLNELRLESVDLQKLKAAGEPGPDLARFATAYDAELTQRGLVDWSMLLTLAVHQKHPWRSLPMLWLDLPVRHQRQRSFLQSFAGEDLLALTLARDSESRVALEELLGVTAAPVPGSTFTTLGRLRRDLFAPQLEEAATDASLDLFSAPGEGLECVEIARRIHAAARQGIPFDGMAVVLRGPDRYQPLLEEALRRAGVPFYASRGTARPDPAGRAFLALLACAAEGCSASRFAEYLSLAQVPDLNGEGEPLRASASHAAMQDEVLAAFSLPDDDAGEPEDKSVPLVTPAGWERLLVDAAVVGGRARWVRRLDGLHAELRFQMARADADALPHLERRAAQLRHLRHFALPLIDLLDRLPGARLWANWITQLTELAETALKVPGSVLGLLAELAPMGQVGPAGLDEVYAVLEERLRFLRRDPPHRREGRVMICTGEEARGRTFPLVFVPGLAEGIFPQRANEDPLLLDVYRPPLGQLAVQETRVERERLLLHIAVGAAGERLVVSYPRMDTGKARPRVPSFYALEVVRAAEGRLPDLTEFGKSAAANAPSRLGWPAPADPKFAIDDAEYDLATLERYRNRPEARGAARYLVQVSEPLARSLRARYQRWRSSWSEADGLVRAELPVLDLLAEKRPSQHSFSPTTLQHFAECPYKFLLHGIQRLRPREVSAPLEQMDPLTRGALFHEVQKLLLESPAMPVTRANLTAAYDQADVILNQLASGYREQLAPAIPRVWNAEVEEVRTDLRGWLRQVAIAGTDWSPLHAEYAFGLKDKSDVPAATILDQYLLRGSVDLVERHATGNSLRITDHKTGKAPEKVPLYVGGGTVLQPVLYALAMEQLLGRPVESGRLFYCTQRGGYREMTVRLNDQARHHMGRLLSTVEEAVATGFLPAAPAQEACARCDYKPVCGPYEYERSRRKSARLEPLYEIRRMP
ncbi:MAG: PD-(D/E)XK nuclease family protein [Bryobacteraceae bacterium]|nr:PD-(D/E)XK nuclease family protein [Bryobacteraceae bacterium]